MRDRVIYILEARKMKDLLIASCRSFPTFHLVFRILGPDHVTRDDDSGRKRAEQSAAALRPIARRNDKSVCTTMESVLGCVIYLVTI